MLSNRFQKIKTEPIMLIDHALFAALATFAVTMARSDSRGLYSENIATSNKEIAKV